MFARLRALQFNGDALAPLPAIATSGERAWDQRQGPYEPNVLSGYRIRILRCNDAWGCVSDVHMERQGLGFESGCWDCSLCGIES